MSTVNIFDAKTNLSRLVHAVETGEQTEIVIARNGRPAAKLVAISKVAAGPRIGVAKGKFVVPATIDDDNGAVAALFTGVGGE